MQWCLFFKNEIASAADQVTGNQLLAQYKQMFFLWVTKSYASPGC